MVSPIRDAAIDGMVEAMLAPAPKIQLTIKKKVDICKAASFFGGCLNTFVQDYNSVAREPLHEAPGRSQGEHSQLEVRRRVGPWRRPGSLKIMATMCMAWHEEVGERLYWSLFQGPDAWPHPWDD